MQCSKMGITGCTIYTLSIRTNIPDQKNAHQDRMPQNLASNQASESGHTPFASSLVRSAGGKMVWFKF